MHQHPSCSSSPITPQYNTRILLPAVRKYSYVPLNFPKNSSPGSFSRAPHVFGEFLDLTYWIHPRTQDKYYRDLGARVLKRQFQVKRRRRNKLCTQLCQYHLLYGWNHLIRTDYAEDYYVGRLITWIWCLLSVHWFGVRDSHTSFHLLTYCVKFLWKLANESNSLTSRMAAQSLFSSHTRSPLWMGLGWLTAVFVPAAIKNRSSRGLMRFSPLMIFNARVREKSNLSFS